MLGSRKAGLLSGLHFFVDEAKFLENLLDGDDRNPLHFRLVGFHVALTSAVLALKPVSDNIELDREVFSVFLLFEDSGKLAKTRSPHVFAAGTGKPHFSAEYDDMRVWLRSFVFQSGVLEGIQD